MTQTQIMSRRIGFQEPSDENRQPSRLFSDVPEQTESLRLNIACSILVLG
jgi:hypothetical protein